MIVHQVSNSYGNYSYNATIYTKTLWETHFHRNYELIYAMEGETEIALNGVRYTLKKGEWVLISAYTLHSLRGKENSRVWVSVFSDDYIRAFYEKNRFKSFIKFRCDKKTEEILKEFLISKEKPEHYLLISCLYMVCNSCVNDNVSCDTMQNDKFIYKISEYISENLNQEITLKHLAYSLNYEYHYFSGLFNKHFNMNFRKFINIFRFEAAVKLMGDKTESISSVCDKCGFGSIRNFNRVFKQLAGVTPNEYRKTL